MGPRSIIVAVVISLGLVAPEVRSAGDEPGANAKPGDRGPATPSARPHAPLGGSDAREESRLQTIADRKRQAVMLLGRFHQGLFQARGSAFVISKSRRLLATCGHVADWLHNDGSMLAVAGGDGPQYKVTRAWYHPGLRRYLDWDLPVRSTDPKDGTIHGGPDLAVIEVAADGPELTGEWTLAGPDELPRDGHPAVGKLGFGMDRPRWFAEPRETPLRFGVGVIEGSLRPKPAADGEPADPPMLTITAQLRQGDSGGPIFLPGGHVVAVSSQVHLSTSNAGPEAGHRVDSRGLEVIGVRVILDEYGLLKSLRRGAEHGAAPVARRRWKPDPHLETYRKAAHAAQEAEAWWLGQEDAVKAIACCDEAIQLVPRYGSAYMRRGMIRALALDANRGRVDRAERLGQLSAAIEDIARGARLVSEDGFGRNLPYSSTFQTAMLMSIRLFNDKGDLESNQGCYASAVATANSFLRFGDFVSARGRAQALGGRGRARLKRGEFREAIQDFDQAIKLVSNFADLFTCRALAKVRLGMLTDAIVDSNEAIRLDPRSGPAFRSRGDALIAQGNLAGAIRDLNESIRLDPEEPEAFADRGTAWTLDGKFDRAIADFDHATRLNPRLLRASNNLAWLLATCPVAKSRDGKRAVEVATRACEQTNWKDATFLDTLATAHAEAGEFARALEFEEKALALLPDHGNSAPRLKARLALFRDGKPFREDPSANRRQKSAPEGKSKEDQT